MRALPGGELLDAQQDPDEHHGVISFFGKDFQSKDAVFWQETPKSIFKKKKKTDLPKIEETKNEDISDNFSLSKFPLLFVMSYPDVLGKQGKAQKKESILKPSNILMDDQINDSYSIYQISMENKKKGKKK